MLHCLIVLWGEYHYCHFISDNNNIWSKICIASPLLASLCGPFLFIYLSAHQMGDHLLWRTDINGALTIPAPSYSLLENAKNTHTKMVCLNCGLKHDCFLSKAISENTAIQLFFNIICFSTDGHLVMPIMYERSPDGWDQHAALSNS